MGKQKEAKATKSTKVTKPEKAPKEKESKAKKARLPAEKVRLMFTSGVPTATVDAVTEAVTDAGATLVQRIASAKSAVLVVGEGDPPDVCLDGVIRIELASVETTVEVVLTALGEAL